MNRREFFAMLAASAVGAGAAKVASAAPIAKARTLANNLRGASVTVGPWTPVRPPMTATEAIRLEEIHRFRDLRHSMSMAEYPFKTPNLYDTRLKTRWEELEAMQDLMHRMSMVANPTYQVVGPKYSIEFVDGTK